MTDIVKRLRGGVTKWGGVDCAPDAILAAADEIERLRADLLKAEMRVEIAGLENIMRAVARGRREGIEAAANVCTKFLSTIQSEIDRASTNQEEEALWAAFLTVDEVKASILTLPEEPAHD